MPICWHPYRCEYLGVVVGLQAHLDCQFEQLLHIRSKTSVAAVLSQNHPAHS